MSTKNYQYDKTFLRQHLNIVELQRDRQKLLLTPDLQGRVLTSTATGESLSHVHTTQHYTGPREALRLIARQLLNNYDIYSAF